MTVLSRRTFLAGTAGALLLTACGSGDSETSATSDLFIVAALPDGIRTPAIFEAGSPARLVFAARTTADVLRENAPESIDITITLDGEPFTEATLIRHVEGIPTPYFPYTFTPDKAGLYEFTPVGTDVPAQIQIAEFSTTGIPQVGSDMIPFDTPTFADPKGIEAVCTLLPEPCPLHDLTLTEALATGGPTLLYVGSPAYCQTVPQICGPTLELVLAAHAERADFSMVHTEVWNNACNLARLDECIPAPIIDTYGLVFEPVAFVANADGIITARLDASWDRADLDTALDSAA